MVKAWDHLFNKSNVPFAACDFYTHLMRLPFECHASPVGRKIFRVLGCVKEMQIRQYDHLGEERSPTSLSFPDRLFAKIQDPVVSTRVMKEVPSMGVRGSYLSMGL